MTAPPRAMAPTLIDAVVTPALNAALSERARSIADFGHTAAADDALILAALEGWGA
jgi:hypothetical protein